jgi:phosphatidylserine decarboxylase
LRGRRNPFVAREGIPFLLLSVVAFAVAAQYLNPWFAVAAGCLFLFLYLLFRDPHRTIPSAPLGVVSPVDGKVLLVDQIEHGLPGGRAHRIRIRIDSFGTYTARAPVEGKVRDLRHVPVDREVQFEHNGLWLQTDEGDDVVLQFSAYCFGLAPSALQGSGERIGQGERCAYLRLARIAEVHLPIAGQVLVQPGQIVVAGADLIGKVPHP